MDIYTEDFSTIMSTDYERALVMDIMRIWDKDGLPETFWDKGVKFANNRNSGNVFLVNEEYQVLMERDGKLEEFYSSPYDGHEGFLDELIEAQAEGDWHDEDTEWLEDIKSNQPSS